MSLGLELKMVFILDRHRAPLAVIDGLPGDGAEFSADQLRALAQIFSRAADDLEACPFNLARYRKNYVLSSTQQTIAGAS